MASQIFVNLAVDNLQHSVDFFTAIGFRFDPQFSNDDAACLILGDRIFAMLLRKEFFKSYTPKPLADAHKSTEVLLTFDVDSREEVDMMIEKVLLAGGAESNIGENNDWIYSRAFEDPDGHIWEVAYMDLSATPPKNSSSSISK